MAPDEINNDGDVGLDDLDLDAAIGAAEELTGTAGDGLGLDLEDVLNADSAAEGLTSGLQKYDFNRPHSMSRPFEQHITSVAESFAKTCAIDFTSLLRLSTSVEFQGLRQSTFGEVVEELPNPTCAALVTLAPLKGYSLVNIDLSLCFVFLKKLMGGQPEPEDSVREFTEIERGINAGLVDRFTEILRKAFAKLVDITPKFSSLENNPNYLSGIAEGESLLLLKFMVKLDTVEGPVEFGLPFSGFGPVKDIFDPQVAVEMRTQHELRDDRKKILEMIQGVGSELVVQLGSIESSLDEVLNLKVGDIIQLPQAVAAPLLVHIEGQEAWLGEAGRLGQNRAVKLIQQLNKE